MELLAGLGIGVIVAAVGFGFFGFWLFSQAMGQVTDTIQKTAYVVKYPQPLDPPVQIEDVPTEHTFDDLSTDDERMPDWMDEEYKIG